MANVVFIDFMKHIDLFRTYNSEEKCIKLFKSWRDKNGVSCKRCSGTQHTWISTRKRYRCKTCRWETTLRSGTALECSKLPYMYWIYAIILLNHGKKPISAKELQGLLGHKYYLPVWALLHKLRVSMGLVSSLSGMDEFIRHGDVVMPVVGLAKKKNTNRMVLGGIKGVRVRLDATRKGVTPVSGIPDLARNPMSGASYIRMVADCCLLQSPTKRFSRIGASEPVKAMEEKDVTSADAIHKADLSRQLTWIHAMAFNARRNFLGIYHNVSVRYFQNYLAEFCFLTNRRNMGREKFKSLLGLIVQQPWYRNKVQHAAYSVVQGAEMVI